MQMALDLRRFAICSGFWIAKLPPDGPMPVANQWTFIHGIHGFLIVSSSFTRDQGTEFSGDSDSAVSRLGDSADCNDCRFSCLHEPDRSSDLAFEALAAVRIIESPDHT